jgi:ketosteroid isomerase-like protein
MTLRPVAEDERADPPAIPLSLTEAVASGDVLAMLLAQRRMIAETMAGAAENTRPQLNNELNKLHVLIREEEARVAKAAEDVAAEVEAKKGARDGGAARGFTAEAI